MTQQNVATAPPAAASNGLGSIVKYFDERRWSWGSVIGGLSLWEFTSRVIVGSKLFLAAPSQVIYALYDLVKTGEIWKHVWISSLEFILGYVIACFLGVVMGFLMAGFRACKQSMQPWVSGLYATPTVALAPLFILWFGIGITSKVMVVALLAVLMGLNLLAAHTVRFTVQAKGGRLWSGLAILAVGALATYLAIESGASETERSSMESPSAESRAPSSSRRRVKSAGSLSIAPLTRSDCSMSAI